MSDLEAGQARMTHPDPGVDDAIVLAPQVPHFEYVGWKYVEGDREHWPQELQRFEGQAQVRIRHPETGGVVTMPESAVPHWRSVGWEVVDPDAEQAEELAAKKDALSDLTVEELKDEIRDINTRRPDDDQLPVSGTKAELLERLRALDDSRDTDQAGDEPAQTSEEE